MQAKVLQGCKLRLKLKDNQDILAYEGVLYQAVSKFRIIILDEGIKFTLYIYIYI